jgi:hypothetical protein
VLPENPVFTEDKQAALARSVPLRAPQAVGLWISHAETYSHTSSDQLLRLLMKARTAAVHPAAALFVRFSYEVSG